MKRAALAALLAHALAFGASAAEEIDAVPLTAEQVKARWHGRLDSARFTSRVLLSMDLGGLREDRELLVWRADEDGSAERVMIRFESPPSLRNVAVLFLEQTGRPNDYFLYQPELRRVRRIPETVANEDVYGVDLEFLGFGVAQSEPTEVEGMTVEALAGRTTYCLEESALRANPRFDERLTWIDAETFVPVRTEHRRRGALRMVASVIEIGDVQGTPTPLRMQFDHPQEKRGVTLVVASVDYATPIPEEYFSTLALVRASAGLDARVGAQR